LHITPKIDRDYFFSLYFRSPAACSSSWPTENPGFTRDEPLNELGRTSNCPGNTSLTVPASNLYYLVSIKHLVICTQKNILTAAESWRTQDKALILVHGRGGSAGDILFLADELAVGDYALLAPQAKGNTWYPNSFLAPPAQK